MKQEYDLTGKVMGLARKVPRLLGPGFVESIYQKALQYEVVRAGWKVEMEVPIQVRYDSVNSV